MLSEFCNLLYDNLRSRIIHIIHLETLAELVTILKVEMIEEHVKNSGKEDTRSSPSPSAAVLAAKELSTFETVCTQMLEDVQERLVYRTQVYIRTEILSYKPSPGDIAYPEKLEMMQASSFDRRRESKMNALLGLENRSIAQRPASVEIELSIVVRIVVQRSLLRNDSGHRSVSHCIADDHQGRPSLLARRPARHVVSHGSTNVGLSIEIVPMPRCKQTHEWSDAIDSSASIV